MQKDAICARDAKECGWCAGESSTQKKRMQRTKEEHCIFLQEGSHEVLYELQIRNLRDFTYNFFQVRRKLNKETGAVKNGSR